MWCLEAAQTGYMFSGTIYSGTLAEKYVVENDGYDDRCCGPQAQPWASLCPLVRGAGSPEKAACLTQSMLILDSLSRWNFRLGTELQKTNSQVKLNQDTINNVFDSPDRTLQAQDYGARYVYWFNRKQLQVDSDLPSILLFLGKRRSLMFPLVKVFARQEKPFW